MKKIFSMFLAIIMMITSFAGITVFANEYAVEGPSMVVLPSDSDTDVMYVVDYSLYCGSQKLDARFSIEGDTENLIMTDDGHLITSAHAEVGSITVKALYEGTTYTKSVTLKKGDYITFENETVGQKPTGWVNRDVQIASESDGLVVNKYLDNLSTYGRYDFPSGDLAGDSTTIEWDVKFTLSGTTVKPASLITLTHNWANAQHSSGGYYYNIYARHSNGKVELYRQNIADGSSVSWPYTAGVLGTVDADKWVNIKLVLNYTDKEYSIYVNNEIKADRWNFESTVTDYATLVGMMPYGKVDNIKVYTGTPGAYSAVAPSQNVMLPESGKQSTLKLGMNLTVGSQTYNNVKTNWVLKNPYSGVSVSGNVLTVTHDAVAGDVILVPEDSRFNCEKTVTINEPTIYLGTNDDAVLITAEANTEYNILLYHPKAQGTDLAEKYLDAYTVADSDVQVTSDSFTTDTEGKYTYSTQGLGNGLYNVYVEPASGVTGEVASITLYNKINELLSDSAAMESPKFLELLINEGADEPTLSHNTYKGLVNKDFAVTLIQNNLYNFPAATFIAYLMELEEVNSDACTFATDILEVQGYDASSIELLKLNQNYGEVTLAVMSDGVTNIDSALESIYNHSVLKGIKNAASVDAVKIFVASLGISKFDGARESQKDYMAGLVMNNTYSSLSVVEGVINSADLSVVEVAYHIDGSSSVVLPAKANTMSVVTYSLIDTELDTIVDAEFYLSGDSLDGLYITKDGKLITSPVANTGNIKVNAIYEGKTYSKEVNLKSGFYCDFESDNAGQKPNGWVDREVVIASDSDGNNYLDSLDNYARYNFADDLAKGTVTVEYDIKYTVTDNKINTANSVGFTHGWTNRAENKGRYYLGMSAALSSDKSQVEFSRGYNQNGAASNTLVGSAPINEWISVKHVFNFTDKTYDIYINSAKVASGWKIDSDITEATLVGIIPYGFTDNFNVYSGETGTFGAVAPPQSAALPQSGKTSEVELNFDLTINGTTYNNVIANWQLKIPYEGVSVNNNVLTVTDSASAGTVYLTSSDGNMDVTKEVTLFEPTILLDIQGTNLDVSAKSGESYNIYIYKNKGGAELIDNFITPTFYGDDTADVIEVLNKTANASGKISYSLSDIGAGVYNIYVKESASEAEVAHIQYISGLSELFGSTANITGPKFLTFLTNQGVSYEVVFEAQNIYKNLNDKTFVYGLINNDIAMFPIAVSLCSVLQSVADKPSDRAFLSAELKAKGYDDCALELLRKNAVYSEAATATVSAGLTDVQTVLDNLKTNSILCGIKNVANKRDAKVFLENIGSDIYSRATNEQKNTIADAVAKRAFATIDDVKLAVAGVNLSASGSQSGGPGGVSTSGGSAGGFGTTYPTVKPVQPSGTYTDVPTDFWAKDAIETLSAKGIIAGFNGMFRPNDTLTRGEMAKIITVAANLQEGTGEFNDVAKTDWFYSYVGAAYKAGLINGYNGNFNPYANVTRQDVAVILYRLFGDKLQVAKDMSFTDRNDVADYALEAVASLSKAGIINGYEDGSFKPQNNISRAEIAKLMVNCMNLWEVNSNE